MDRFKLDRSKIRPVTPERRKELDEMLKRAIEAGKVLKEHGIELIA